MNGFAKKTLFFRWISLVLCCFLILSSPISADDSVGNSDVPEFIREEIQRAREESSALADSWYDIMSIGLSNGKEPTLDNTVLLESEKDSLFLIFDFANGSKAEYVLKIFVDYIESEFKIDGETYEEYYFTADATEGFAIEFFLPENKIDLNQSHTITVAMFKDPRTHRKPVSTERDSYSADFTLTGASKQSEQQSVLKHNWQAEFYEIPFSGIMLNRDMELKDDNEVYFPPDVLDAAPDETVTLVYRASGYEDSSDILFLLLVDWKQTDINGKPYAFTENQHQRTNCGLIEFKAPQNPGEYEVIALMSGYPFELRNERNCALNFASMRFTLVVE